MEQNDEGKWITDPTEQIVEGDQSHAAAMDSLRTDGRRNGFVLFTRDDEGTLSVRAFLVDARSPRRLGVWASFIYEYAELLGQRVNMLMAQRLWNMLFADDEEGDDNDEN